MDDGLFEKIRITARDGWNEIREKSKKWYGRFQDEFGKTVRKPLCEDKEALTDAGEQVRSFPDQAESSTSTTTIAEASGQHPTDFENSLRDNGNTEARRAHVAPSARGSGPADRRP
jgi:hypothetical protein